MYQMRQPTVAPPKPAGAVALTTYQTQNNRPNQRYSLEQIRFLNRIKNASHRMNEMYKLQVTRAPGETEKGRYAKLLELRELENYGPGSDVYSPMAERQAPLGKVVTQVEMNNAEARSELREMLEYQIREKERHRDMNSN